MPNLTVIKGGGRGPHDTNAHDARIDLGELIVEVLRSVARGYDSQERLTRKLAAFIEIAPTISVPLNVIIHSVLQEFAALLAQKDFPEQVRQYELVVHTSLYLAAETCANDPGARGRAGRRDSELRQHIEAIILRRQMCEAAERKKNRDCQKQPGKKKS